MKPLTRRTALTAIAAAPVAVATLPARGVLCKDASEGGELAALVRRYFKEVAAFNADPPEDDEAFFATQPYDLTLREIVGAPVRTREDALAVIEFMERDNCIEMRGPMESLVDGLRVYLEGRTA